MRANCISVIGAVGVPANYGGFETLVENLARFNENNSTPSNLTIYCSSKAYPEKKSKYHSSRLRYIPLNANGPQSIPYDVLSIISAIWHRSDVILLLGVSGAIALPLVRLITSARIVTNIDGIEWRRQKWKGIVKRYLHFSEKIAVRFSNEVICDNAVIAEYVKQNYGVESHVIAYGGDHALIKAAEPVDMLGIPEKYAFSVCRIEPENNVHLIIEAFSCQDVMPLVMVGNWDKSEYGRKLRTKYAACSHLRLLDPIYDLGKLKTLRLNCTFYVHGHSAGGTNPSLVEAMHFGRPILAYDCDFNRATTENKAQFFANATKLLELIKSAQNPSTEKAGQELLEIAQRRYTWNVVANEYFSLLNSPNGSVE
jgi:glycosyltransferase involved in cell wall biosynthesis